MKVQGMEVTDMSGAAEICMPLLLDADPSRELVESYLARGRLWGCTDDKGPVCVALMMPVEPGAVELMNLCTRADMRGRGIAGALVAAMKRLYAGKYAVMRVGTADGFPQVQRFYERCGFALTGIDRGFFVRNYPEPVMDGGRQCVDMARYELRLDGQK